VVANGPLWPATPEQLVMHEPDTAQRIVLVTQMAQRRGSLPSALARQRDLDVLKILETGNQALIAAITGLSRQRVSKLAERAQRRT